MDLIKKLWPLAFQVKQKDVTSLVVQLIVSIIVAVVIGVAIGLIVWLIPILGLVAGIVGGLVELYTVINIVLCVVNFFTVLK